MDKMCSFGVLESDFFKRGFFSPIEGVVKLFNGSNMDLPSSKLTVRELENHHL